MTIGRFSLYNIRAETPGTFRNDVAPFTGSSEPARYCGCGTRMRSTNRARLCDPCDHTIRSKQAEAALLRIRWLEERGLA